MKILNHDCASILMGRQQNTVKDYVIIVFHKKYASLNIISSTDPQVFFLSTTMVRQYVTDYVFHTYNRNIHRGVIVTQEP